MPQPQPINHDRLAARRELRERESFIIDTLFPSFSVHLIGGDSGAGKTTWLLQLMHDWDCGVPLFGKYASHKVPWVYISADRTLRDTDRTLCRLGLQDWEIPAYCVTDTLTTDSKGRVKGQPDFNSTLERFPSAKLFVIEGFQSFIDSCPRGENQNKHEQVWMMKLQHEMERTGRTIIATTHSPKMIAGERVTGSPRSRFLGSQALIGACSTMVHIEAPDRAAKGAAIAANVDRQVWLGGRDFPDHLAYYSRDENNGMLILDSLTIGAQTTVVENENDHNLKMHTHLTSIRPGDTITTDMMLGWGEASNMGRASIYRWIQNALDRGWMQKIGHGKYTRIKVN